MRFHPRDAMHKHSICCGTVSVRLSVLPSVTVRYSIKAA